MNIYMQNLQNFVQFNYTFRDIFYNIRNSFVKKLRIV